MGECICSICKNLKVIPNENGAIEEYDCEFGLPSEQCENCENDLDACEFTITCTHFVKDDVENEVILFCRDCGMALNEICDNTEAGEVYCINCYLKNNP